MNMKSIFKSAVAAFLLVSSFVVVAQDAEALVKKRIEVLKAFGNEVKEALQKKKLDQYTKLNDDLLLYMMSTNKRAQNTEAFSEGGQVLRSETCKLIPGTKTCVGIFGSGKTYMALHPEKWGSFSHVRTGTGLTNADDLGKVLQAYFSSTLNKLEGKGLKSLQKDLDKLHDVIVDIFKNMAALHKLTESSACIKHPAGECKASDSRRLTVLENSSKKCFASKEDALKDVKEACERSEKGARWVESQQGKTQKK